MGKMMSLRNFLEGVYSLGMGAPSYRHTDEPLVPWPRTDHPLRNPSDSTTAAWAEVMGVEDTAREIRRLSLVEPPSTPRVISRRVIPPSRVTYSTTLPMTECPLRRGVEPNEYTWRGVSVTEPGPYPDGEVLPGYCMIRELRVLLPSSACIVEAVKFSVEGRMLQRIDCVEEMIRVLQTLMGIPLTFEAEVGRVVTLPLFFGRDPTYALPAFLFRDVEVSLVVSSPDSPTTPRLFASMDLIHSEREVNAVREMHVQRVEDVGKTGVDRWLFAPVFWKWVARPGGPSASYRVEHDGGRDEEIRGLFWHIEGETGDVNVSVEYSFEGGRGPVSLVGPIPHDVLTETELRGRILPTTSCARYTPPEERRGYGAVLLSPSVDSTDCEPGVSPRNGILELRFSRPVRARVVALTSKDFVVPFGGKRSTRG